MKSMLAFMAGVVLGAGILHAQEATATRTGDPPKEPAVGIRFKGLLPGSVSRDLEGVFPVEFRIYRSPQGGEAVWHEALDVVVEDGLIDVVLGRENPVPMEIHEATFKFLGASVAGNREVYPRFPIVNVVYVSPKEALLAVTERKTDYARPSTRLSEPAGEPASWRDALERARAKGGDLAEYDDWYLGLEACTPGGARERADHYEWVLPWVYDSASHGRLNRYFRGRFQGCDYMDLSPKKSYRYRVADPLDLDR